MPAKYFDAISIGSTKVTSLVSGVTVTTEKKAGLVASSPAGQSVLCKWCDQVSGNAGVLAQHQSYYCTKKPVILASISPPRSLFDFGIAPITTVCTIPTLIVQEGGGANAAIAIVPLASPGGIDVNTSSSSSNSSSSGARSVTLKLDDRSYNSGANARSSYTFKQKAACLVIHDKLVEENPTWTKQAVAEETAVRCHIGYDTWKKWLPIKQRDIIFAGWRGDEWAQKFTTMSELEVRGRN